MGGGAFTSGADALYTPRMPKNVYLYAKKKYHALLLQYFTYVATPIEAPGKENYGDIDYIVSLPKPSYIGPEQLMKDLGAIQRRSSGPTGSYAVPWPLASELELVGSDSTSAKGALPGTEIDETPKFIQLDVAIEHKGDAFYKWEIFHKAHGDMWNMLGSTIRKYGLAANNQGLHLRIEEIELVDRKRSLVFITNDPGTVLEFLGLPKENYWQSFGSVGEMFEYAAQCRFFWVKQDETEVKMDEQRIAEEGEKDKKELKHNDRQRMSKRPIFKMWVEEFIPECRRKGTFVREVPSREETAEEVFVRFPGTKEVYDERLENFRREKQADQIWRDVIKSFVPELEDNRELRGASIRGLKAIIMAEDYSLGVVPDKILKFESGFYNVEAVAEFVKGNWQHVGEVGMERQRMRAAESLTAKRL